MVKELRKYLEKSFANCLGEYFARVMNRCRRERGMALLASMLAIALMTIIVVDFTSSAGRLIPVSGGQSRQRNSRVLPGAVRPTRR